MKRLTILLLLLSSYSHAEYDCESSDYDLNGSNNGTSYTTLGWLNRAVTDSNGDEDPTGLDCSLEIYVSDRDAVVSDAAYFSKQHSPTQEVQFQFTLLNYSLLESFASGDRMDLYTFNSTSGTAYENPKELLKIELQRNDLGWALNFNWYQENDRVIRPNSVVQSVSFDSTVQQIEVLFFLSGTEWVDNSSIAWDTAANSHSSSGLFVRKNDDIPQIFMNPFRWSYETNSLSGVSRLGYLNADLNPALQGDQMLFVSRPIRVNTPVPIRLEK